MIKKAELSDVSAVTRLAVLLWPDNTLDEMEQEFKAFISDEDSAIFLYLAGDEAAGFAHCQLRRDYVEGTHTSPVGYLEAIFVQEAYRDQGTASALLLRCEEWARAKGCAEFASDCELANDASLQFHLRMGFKEASRIICFTKSLS